MICRACDHPLECHGDRAVGACDGGLTIDQIRPGLALKVERHADWSKCFCLGFDAY